MVVYCKDDDGRGEYSATNFGFLGYTFRVRRSKNRWGGVRRRHNALQSRAGGTPVIGLVAQKAQSHSTAWTPWRINSLKACVAWSRSHKSSSRLPHGIGYCRKDRRPWFRAVLAAGDFWTRLKRSSPKSSIGKRRSHVPIRVSDGLFASSAFVMRELGARPRIWLIHTAQSTSASRSIPVCAPQAM